MPSMNSFEIEDSPIAPFFQKQKISIERGDSPWNAPLELHRSGL